MGPVLELPTSLRGARWAPSRSAATAVLAVVVLVAVVFGVRVWLAARWGRRSRGVTSRGGAQRV